MTTPASPQPAPLVVEVLDLTVDQVSELERASGVAFTSWTSGRAPMSAVLKACLVQLGGWKPEAAGKLTLRELAGAITLRFGGSAEGD